MCRRRCDEPPPGRLRRRRGLELRRRWLVVVGPRLPGGAGLRRRHHLIVTGRLCLATAVRALCGNGQSRHWLGRLRNRGGRLCARLRAWIRFGIDRRGRLISAGIDRLPGAISEHRFHEAVFVSRLAGVDELPTWIECLAH